MVPSAFLTFFTASAGAGAALVGLLFVAVSLAPEQIVTRHAPVERQAVAGSAFTALVNVFFISLVALIPTAGVGPVVALMGAFSCVATSRLAINLLLRRDDGKRLTLTQLARRLSLIVASLVIYGLEIWQGFQLPTTANVNPDAIIFVAFLIVATYGLALTRMWSLLGARKDSVFAWLNVLNDIEE